MRVSLLTRGLLGAETFSLPCRDSTPHRHLHGTAGAQPGYEAREGRASTSQGQVSPVDTRLLEPELNSKLPENGNWV